MAFGECRMKERLRMGELAALCHGTTRRGGEMKD